jgi:hypothetical protein
MAMGDAAFGCGAGCAKIDGEAANARLSASAHIAGFGRKDSEINFLFKRNNLEVSEKENTSGDVYMYRINISIH